jgi:hypothetical protein
MPLLDDFLHRFAQYLLAITIIALLVVGEWELGVSLTSPQPEDCIAILLNRD